MSDPRPTLLILSFSQVYRDARVLKQVRLFEDRYRVVTCSYGPAPSDRVEHVQIPDTESISYMNGRLITLKMYRAVYWGVPAIRWVSRALRGRRFDAILANDFESVGVALALKPVRGVHSDLHEYAPSQFEHLPAWARRIRPYREWVCKHYVSRAKSWTTVCQGLADKYQEMFGFRASLVTNAAPYVDLSPTPVSQPLRLVHHGGAAPARGIDRMIRAVMASEADVILDLYLNDVDRRHVGELRELASPDPRIHVLDPVPYEQLIPMLNTYDVGLSFILPNTFNLLHALPNKTFDYVQARIGIIVGPSPEMARLVRDNGLGEVTEDFSEDALTKAVNALTTDRIADWSHNCDQSAFRLSSEAQNEGWLRPIAALIGPGR